MKIKSLVAAAVAVATVTAGVVIGIAAPASAHSLTLTGVASCVPSSSDGTVDWQLSNDYGTETSVTASDNASIPVGTTVPKNGSIHLTQSVAGPVNAGAYVSANLTLKWTDGFTQNVASGKVKFAAACKQDVTVSWPTVTPPTCDADGTLPFLDWPAAQNPNGYRGKGYDLYLDRAYAGPGTYTVTIYKQGGYNLVGLTSGSSTQLTVAPKLTGLDCAGPKPDTLITYTDWKDGQFVCGDTTVTQTREKSVTEYTLVGNAWVAGTPVVTTETQTRAVTPQENLSCHPSQTCSSDPSKAYSEDVPPVQTADGLLFQGQGAAVDYYIPATGNLQGLGDQSITFADVHGYQPSFTVVFYRDGSTGYANLVAEWYQNGGSPDTAGTFAINQSTLFWTNKIASGAGSQADPQPLSFFELLYPNNQLISFGPHLGSAQTEATHSLVTAIGGCANVGFVPTHPEPKVVTSDWKNGDYGCGDTTVEQTRTITTTPYAWDESSASYVLDERAATEKTETQTVKLTAEQIAALHCPTNAPSTGTSSTPAPVAVASGPTPTDTLAHTGSVVEAGGPLTLVGFLVGLGVIAVAAGAVIRRRRDVVARHSDE